ncbi:TIM barrel protein [bacterium]|nr:TIM barrel protein [bacterium]
MYLSVSSYTWLPSSFQSNLSLLQDHGIEGVEIFCTPRHLDISDPEAVQKAGMMVRELGFQGVTMHAPITVGDLSDPDELQRDETVIACQRALDAGMLMGANVVTFHPSSIEGEMSQAAERWVSLEETLQDLGGYAEDRDVNIAIENFPCPFFGCDPLELYNRIANLNLPNVGITLDIGHAFCGGHLPEILNQLGEKVFSVHASDNRGRVDEHLTPGQGFVPWEEIITGLRQMGYAGPFVIEVRDGKSMDRIVSDVSDFADRMGLVSLSQLSH